MGATGKRGIDSAPFGGAPPPWCNKRIMGGEEPVAARSLAGLSDTAVSHGSRIVGEVNDCRELSIGGFDGAAWEAIRGAPLESRMGQERPTGRPFPTWRRE